MSPKLGATVLRQNYETLSKGLALAKVQMFASDSVTTATGLKIKMHRICFLNQARC